MSANLYRGIIPFLVLTFQGFFMFLNAFGPWIQPGNFYFRADFSEGWRVLAAAAGIAGLVLVVGAKRAMGKAFTIQPIARADGFLALGWPFTWVRNPMYVGALLIGAAWGSWHSSVPSLAAELALALVLAVKVRIEERSLEQKYGEEYRAYCGRVGRFVPKLGRR